MTTRNGTNTESAMQQQTNGAANRPALYGALLAGTGVAFGAFGAHALNKALSPAMLEVFETGVRYQMYHALGLLALGALPAFQGQTDRAPSRVPGLLLAGTCVFSGSLYLLSFTGVKWLGAITPIGGVLMLAGWGMAAWQLWKGSRS
ncbi:DUF423 domain-containing protein [Deinococcus sp. UYEF24]